MKDFQFLRHIIRNRRSIFPNQFIDKKIPREWIEQILENANWAPNHKHTEPWRFHVFCGEGLKKLSSYMGDHYQKNTTPEKYQERKHRKRINSPLKSSHVIAICMARDAELRVPEWEELAAVSCAVQNMWLSCTALGLGAYWSTPDAALEADNFLNLAENERCLGLFYIGFALDEINPTAKRRSIQDKVVWHES